MSTSCGSFFVGMGFIPILISGLGYHRQCMVGFIPILISGLGYHCQCRGGVYPHSLCGTQCRGGVYPHPNIRVGLSLLLSPDIFLSQRRKRRKEAHTASERKYKRMQSACRVRPLWPSVKNICPCGRPQTSSYLNYCGRPQGPHPVAVRHHALNGYLTASEADSPITPD